MISHWFIADDKTSIRPDRLSKNSLWHQVRFLHDEELHWGQGNLLLISFDRNAGQIIKRNLYQFSATSQHGLQIIDCGYMNPQSPEAIIPILEEMQSSGAMIMMMGAPMSFMRFQSQASKLTAVIRESNLDDDVHLRNVNPHSTFQYIGTQRHLIAENHFHIEGHLRLSDVKEDIALAEPCIRDSQAFIFHCDSMSAAEAGYLTGMSGSGLSVIEACQLFRYGGAAPFLRSTGIYGYETDKDTTGLLANSIAQMIWYFIEGSMMREDPDKSILTKYIVHSKDTEQSILFFKSENSGRWWIENKSGRKVPCSYKDYRRACEEDYSDLIVKAVLED